jgi:hypothetical protein
MNERALGIYLLVALVVMGLVHAVVTWRIARAGRRLAVLGFFVPPLAPYYAWEIGQGYFAIAWVVALLAYAVGVALA